MRFQPNTDVPVPHFAIGPNKGIKGLIKISLSVITFLTLCIVAGCLMARHSVRVTDALTGSPIQGAVVVPVYPSFGGAGYVTDRNGVARIGGFGLPQGGYGVYVSATGYLTNFIGTYPTSENHAGWKGNHMEVSLQPIPKP